MMNALLARLGMNPLLCTLLCFVAGGLSALGMAPYHLWPVLFAGVSLLFLLLDTAKSWRYGFFYGWAFGFGYFAFGLYWIGNALLVDGNPYAWAWPLAVAGLPFALAFFPAAASALMRIKPVPQLWRRYLGFIGWLALFEWLRGHVFTGFPWNLYGYTWAEHLEVAQMASFSSAYFLTFLTIGWAALPGFALLHAMQPARENWRVIAIGIASFAAVFAYGHLRLQNAAPQTHPQSVIQIVQPNIDQAEKWQPDKMMDHYMTLLNLSKPAHDDPALTTYLVWPETALSFRLMDNSYVRALLRDALALYPGQVYLLTGILLRDEDGYYNALALIDKKGDMLGVYNKAHLVPFGEYIPFQKWIPLKPIVAFSGFVAGGGPDNLQTPEGTSFAANICYEAIFPGAVTDRTRPADFIVNVTNDGWYGFSSGPFQHYVSAKFRAIEEGLPLIRAANTGISAVIDGYGRDIKTLNLFQAGAITVPSPQKINVFQRSALAESGIFILLCFLFIGATYINSILKH